MRPLDEVGGACGEDKAKGRSGATEGCRAETKRRSMACWGGSGVNRKEGHRDSALMSTVATSFPMP